MKRVNHHTIQLLLCATVALIARTADILILGSAESFSILNEYEQPMSADDKKAMGANAPFVIDEEDGTLGDQITRVMRATWLGSPRFFLKNDEGGLISKGASVYRRKFTGCTPVLDTVETTRDIVLAERYPSEGKMTTVGKGRPCVVLFKSGSYYYVTPADGGNRYGWCPVSSASSWKKVRGAAAQPDSVINPELRTRLTAKFERADAAYSRFFDHFSRRTGMEKSAPRWSFSASGAQLRWIMSEPYKSSGELDGSTAVLVKEIENILLGKPFLISYKNGVVLVGPREAAP